MIKHARLQDEKKKTDVKIWYMGPLSEGDYSMSGSGSVENTQQEVHQLSINKRLKQFKFRWIILNFSNEVD